MSRAHRAFPIAFRVLAASLALAGLAALTPATSLAAPSKEDVNTAEQRAATARAAYEAKIAEVSQVQGELDAATARLDVLQGDLEEITAHLLETRARISENQERYDHISARLGERAVQAYMDGPGSGLEIILGASSLSDLSDKVEYMGVIAQSDADLAAEVDGLRNLLLEDEATQEALQAKQREKVADQEAVRDSVAANLTALQTAQAQAAQLYAVARETYQDVQAQYKKHQEYLASLPPPPSTYGGSHAAVPIPDGYEDILKVCPVGSPRSYSDGFGAPRYAGGFHLHAGVDILASTGTEIYAPFDGTASTSYNTLGGNSVSVYGAYGHVYNAHLSAYSDNSNGPVKAGDVIGYVGDTGDAKGTPHDHFEFHPNSMPASWPASSYGYSVVGSAVNPYPLLVKVCG